MDKRISQFPVGDRRVPRIALALPRARNLVPDEFEEAYVRKARPVLVERGVNWEASRRWSGAYFGERFAEKVVSLNYADAALGTSFLANERKVTMREAACLIAGTDDPNRRYYLSQQRIATEFPELLSDFSVPSFCVNGRTCEAFLWFGQAGTHTPLHYDIAHNCLVQVLGHKRVRLFAPTDLPYLYAPPPASGHASHVSRIPDIDDVDPVEFPLFERASPYECVMEPGDVLFMPAGWWHDVRTLQQTSISVNFWWHAQAAECHMPLVLRRFGWGVFDAGVFSAKIRELFRLDAGITDLAYAESMLAAGHLWLAVVYAAGHLKDLLTSLVSSRVSSGSETSDVVQLGRAIVAVEPELRLSDAALCRWHGTMTKARAESDASLTPVEVSTLLSEIRAFTQQAEIYFRPKAPNRPEVDPSPDVTH